MTTVLYPSERTVREWTNKLFDEAAGRAGDCFDIYRTYDQTRESILDMLLDFCSDKKVPDHLIGEVASELLDRIH